MKEEVEDIGKEGKLEELRSGGVKERREVKMNLKNFLNKSYLEIFC